MLARYTHAGGILSPCGNGLNDNYGVTVVTRVLAAADTGIPARDLGSLMSLAMPRCPLLIINPAVDRLDAFRLRERSGASEPPRVPDSRQPSRRRIATRSQGGALDGSRPPP